MRKIVLIRFLGTGLLTLSLMGCGDESSEKTAAENLFTEPLYSMNTGFGEGSYLKRYVEDGLFIHESYQIDDELIQDSYSSLNHGKILTQEGLFDTQDIPDSFISSNDSSFTFAYGNTENRSALATITAYRASIAGQSLANFYPTENENLKAFLQAKVMPKGAVQFTTTQIDFPNPFVSNVLPSPFVNYSTLSAILAQFDIPPANTFTETQYFPDCTTLPSIIIANFDMWLVDCPRMVSTDTPYITARFIDENERIFEGHYRAKAEPLVLTYLNQTAFDALQETVLGYYKNQAFLQNLCADGITIHITTPSCPISIALVINHDNDPIVSH